MNKIASLKFIGTSAPFLKYHIHSSIYIFSNRQKFQESVSIAQIGNL